MPTNVLRLIALASALLHAADGALSSVAHCHGPGPCAHGQEDAPAGHRHLAGACRHTHVRRRADTRTQSESSNSDPLAPHSHQHDCAACRHLCQPLGHVPASPDRLASELVECLTATPPDSIRAIHVGRYQSRGPPVAASRVAVRHCA